MFRQLINTTTIVLLSVGLFMSCRKQTQLSSPSEDNATGSFTASILTGDMPSKSYYGKDGAGTFVNRCKLQVWSKNADTGKDELVYEKCTIVVENEVDHSLSSEFKGISFAKGKAYDFLFWTDCSDKNLSDLYYDTMDLHAVRMAGTYIGNDDRRDAFFASKSFTVTKDFDESVALSRPFAQLNTVSTDFKFIYGQLPAATRDVTIAGVTPSDTKITFSAPAEFDVLSGEPVGTSQEFASSASAYRKVVVSSDAVVVEERYTLSMDFIFAPTGGISIPSVGFVASNNGGGMTEVKRTFNDVPLARNCRTDISGALLTGGKETVSVSVSWNAAPGTDPDDPETYPYGPPGEAGPELGNETVPGW